MDEWINKLWYRQTLEYYSALKNEGGPAKPPPGHMGPGGIGGRLGDQAGGRGPPGGVPHPLRPEAGGSLGPFCSVEPKPYTPHPPGPFPALWVLSIGPAHRPNLTPVYAPPPTSKAFSTFFFPSSFFLLWSFWLLFRLYFYFYIFSNLSVSFLV